MILNEYERELKKKIIKSLKKQGFSINPHINIAKKSKLIFRKIQEKARIEQLNIHKKFLIGSIEKVKIFLRNGNDINPENISLELREIRSDSEEEIIFRWWNLIWWSIPYQRPYGRQIRILIWDKGHNSPFGLICLQSPILKMAVRDRYLGIPNENLDQWVNQSLYAQRIGALPPYNDLLGGKLVALTLSCNELRKLYREKYKNTKTIIKGRVLKPELLFITTTSAFGRSSIYNRLNYYGQKVAIPLGYTKGAGTFHIAEDLYHELLNYLSISGIDITRGYGHGPSRKLKLISAALKRLGLYYYEYHGLRREFYLFPLVSNLREVIQKGEKPIWLDRPFDKLFEYWKIRWALPRAERSKDWKKFNSVDFIEKTQKYLLDL